MSEKESNVVEMKDGRTVDFGVRGKKKTDIQVTETGVKLVFDVVNGDTHVAEFEVPACEGNPLLKELFAYGVSQKITDSVVKEKDEDDISLGIQSMIAQLQKGIWSQRTPSEGIARGLADLIEAMCRLKGYAPGSEQSQAVKDKLLVENEDTIKMYKSNPAIKAVMADIAAEKAAARAAKLRGSDSEETSLDDLLNGF